MHVHHAQLLVGSLEWASAFVPESERTPGTDVTVIDTDLLSIATVRELSRAAALRPVSRPYRTFVVSARGVPHEAQNALLKLLEEPNENTLFYVIVPREDVLLATVRSRLHLVATEDSATSSHFEAFLGLSHAKRLAMIADRVTAEDAPWVADILRGMEAYARKRRDPSLIEEILKVESYFAGTGASKKMLLEHLALSL